MAEVILYKSWFVLVKIQGTCWDGARYGEGTRGGSCVIS